ncbi:unnamed protein product [Prorocentrum cordatum]|uniref:Uncharacterized protein n=1 Tax=Prorocentrum cordatum TaxID=2364126 RepID=A0ABN9USJ8_9DINO|nr:unnamed protein product [Polarella glacialis]
MLQNPCRSGAPHNVPTEAEVLVEQPRLPDRAAGGDRAGRSRTATKRPDLLDGAGGAHQRVAGEPPLDEVSLAVRHAAQARVAAAAATAAAAGSRVAARGAVEVAASASAAAAGGGGESPCGQVLQQLGLATLVGALCVGGLLLWHRARSKEQVGEVLATAGACQLAVVFSASAVFLLGLLVELPPHVVVFALGTVWNVVTHSPGRQLSA